MIKETSLIRQHPGVRLDTSLEALLATGRLAGGPAALATIVSTAGSTYAKPGARMLIGADGVIVGLLSGGCLEGDLAAHAAKTQADGVARRIAYDMRGPDDELFGIGAGCEGAMQILIEPTGADLPAVAALQAAGRDTAAGQSAALIIVHESADVALGIIMVCIAKNRLSVASPMTKSPRIHVERSGPTTGMESKRLMMTCAPQKLICPHGSR